MIYLYSGGGDITKQIRVNQAAEDKAETLAQAQQKSVIHINDETINTLNFDDIGAIILIAPSIDLALFVCRRYSQQVDIVIAEGTFQNSKLTVCQIEFTVMKVCVL